MAKKHPMEFEFCDLRFVIKRCKCLEEPTKGSAIPKIVIDNGGHCQFLYRIHLELKQILIKAMHRRDGNLLIGSREILLPLLADKRTWQYYVGGNEFTRHKVYNGQELKRWFAHKYAQWMLHSIQAHKDGIYLTIRPRRVVSSGNGETKKGSSQVCNQKLSPRLKFWPSLNDENHC